MEAEVLAYQGDDRRMNTDTDLKFEMERINNRLNNMESNSEEIKTTVEKILKLINGNGKLGLFSKVHIMWGSGLFLVISVITLLIRSFVIK